MKLKANTGKRILLEVLVLLAIMLMLFRPVVGNEYRHFETGNLHYVRATVLEVQSEELEESTLGTGQKLGEQHLTVRLSNGQEVELDNYLTETHNIMVREGRHVIVCVDAPENSDPHYSIYNYDRTIPLVGLITVFVVLLVLVGNRKGVDSFLSIVFTLLFILRVTLPVLYNGGSPLGMGFLTVLLSTTVTLALLHGPTRQCALGVATTLIGELAACLLFALFSMQFHLTGFQTDSAEGLLLVAQNTGIDIRTLLFAGMMIASLGAVMDVAVSILSALREVALVSKKLECTALFHSGINMGRDMIGTMSNTLIFAFTGGSLATMLVFYSYGVQFHQLLNSDYLTVELVQGLCSTAAVILTVPAAAVMGAVFYGKRHR